jgi:serine phosphatase RsbU (regulator of sigma subunit)
LFFEPKDIVSGDFYWCTQKGDEFILAVADCTGHGVPGAFMTMMGNTLLNNIVNEDNVTDPAKILSLLNTSVQNTLKQQQDEEELREGDGMDVVLINYNLKIRFVTYAGAKNTLFYTKNNEIITLRGTNISIGSTLSKRENVFENHIIYLDGGETFYLTTDGFQDQLGGGEGENTRRRKYMKSRFMEFLLKISTLPISEQSLTIREEFNTFKGSHIQTDDVTVLGFRVV